MKLVGKEKALPVNMEPSAAHLETADRFMASLRFLSGGARRYYPQGVYRFRSHEEADAALLEAVARDMVKLISEREDGSGKVRS